MIRFRESIAEADEDCEMDSGLFRDHAQDLFLLGAG